MDVCEVLIRQVVTGHHEDDLLVEGLLDHPPQGERLAPAHRHAENQDEGRPALNGREQGCPDLTGCFFLRDRLNRSRFSDGERVRR
jgi:hypothetical protein